MKTILFHCNILSEQDAQFVNELAKNLENQGVKLVLVGWNKVPENWGLTPTYVKLPEKLHAYKAIYKEEDIKKEFSTYGLDVDFLVHRFHWWLPEYKNSADKKRRMALLHNHLNIYKKLIKQYNTNFVLIWNGNDPRHIILKTLADSYGIGQLFLERGPLPSVVFYDNLGVLSSSSLAHLKLSQLNVEKENNHYNNYLNWYKNSSETLWEQPETLNNNSIREQFGILDSQKITLFIGQVDQDIQTKLFSPYFLTNLEAFQWFVQHAEVEGWFVLGKHHPKSSLPKESYQKIIDGKKNMAWTDQLSLNDCLDVADNVVAVNSSVIFDALIAKKPVLALGTTMLHEKNILYEFNKENYSEEMLQFYSAQHFKNKLDNFSKVICHMFSNNLVNMKSEKSIQEFSRRLTNMCEIKVEIDENWAYEEEIINNYLRNQYHSRPSLLKKIKRRTKRLLSILNLP